MFQSFDCVRN